ncbi:MAG: thioredoxin family protein [Lewinellaceae bacterium]|nr:thioredoxin family protein [Lewinellaceae bacterium]
MAFTESNMLPIGSVAPKFSLLDTASKNVLSFQDIKGKNGTVIYFICNHCPYVIHVNRQLVDIANEYKAKDIGFVAISSNDAQKYPEDRPELMQFVAKILQYPFPYLYDETQEVARAYDAACTPDIYVFDGEDHLYYRGRLDDSRPGNESLLTGKNLRMALDLLIMGEPPMTHQLPSGGCNIKWKE